MILNNKMTLEFLSKSQNESFARSAIAAFISQLDPTIDEIADVKTAISEGVTNSIIHGYGHPEGIVKIECEYCDSEVKISIQDFGKGIADMEKAMTPFYTESEDGERSGMGFTVMEAFMDSLIVESVPQKGTKLIMTKKISSLLNQER